VAQDEDFSPATREEVISSLSFALRFAGRKRTHKADDFMARIIRRTPGGSPGPERVRGQQASVLGRPRAS